MNREYKSDVFSMLMEIPEYALDIYNVLNASHYKDSSLIRIMKLEKGVLLSIRNDASFLLDSYLNLYEHQSTYNPNMPLRFLIYFSNLMLDILKEQEYDLFGRKQIPVPTPKFVVFYNGTESRPAKEVMHLSDAYEHRENQHALDLTCIVYNINPGYNRDIKKESRVISGYTAFVEKVRFHAKKEKTLKDAIERAVDECIQENILAEFFRERRREVVNVAALDFTFERREKLIRRDSLEEGWEKGREEGRREGQKEGQKSGEERVILQMYEKGFSIEQIADITDKTTAEIREILQHNKKYPA
ncbi:MAG: hypothetical protein NC300_10710 [Bacteroidales bacterium]|nr:hypothetical protein [Clostridium sp.]MCM1204602.1 hypothetical protein [Bacteroidales bacterium]